MTLIDNRILIPASQDKVWGILSDLQQNPQWQLNCQAVSVLTTMKSGQGTRWRSSTQSGREQVIEITAWYDRLGYEYRIVDGTRLQANKGLFRLQEIPEGTIVQWTFSYEPTGFLSGLQDSLRIRRQVEGEIVDSLRQLYRVIANRSEIETFEAKSLMRAAPDVEARAQYQPRHPSNIEDTGPNRIVPAAARAVQALQQSTNLNPESEPVLEEGDTRPNPVVIEPVTTAQTTDTDAPYRPPLSIQPTEAAVAPIKSEALTTTSETKSVEQPATTIVEPERATTETVAVSSTTPEAEPEIPITASNVPDEPSTAAEPVLELLDEEFSGQIDTRELDSAKISVFELFGIPKPSDTQETPRIEIPQITDATDLLMAIVDLPMELPKSEAATLSNTVTTIMPRLSASQSEPVGLRWLLRRQMVSVRRPSVPGE